MTRPTTLRRELFFLLASVAFACSEPESRPASEEPSDAEPSDDETNSERADGGSVLEVEPEGSGDDDAEPPTSTSQPTPGAEPEMPAPDGTEPAAPGGTELPPGATSPPDAPPAPDALLIPYEMSRLTAAQYANCVHDLFPGVELPIPELPTDVNVDGFEHIATAQAPSALHVEAYHRSAQSIAAVVAKNAELLSGCATSPPDAPPPSDDTCIIDYITELAARAYRRPLEEEERETLLARHAEFGSSELGSEAALAGVVQAILESPQFLYRIEVGVPVEGAPERVRLTGFELASRLSFFLWNTQPDAELFDAAATGALDDAEGIETEARRLLAAPRARVAVTSFHARWLHVSQLEERAKDAALYPTYTPELGATLSAATLRFAEEIFFTGGTFQELLTAPYAFTNDAIAPLLGVPEPGTSELVRVDMDPEQRAGVLTQAGLMAALAHEDTSSPVERGVMVLDRLMCSRPPAPPPEVNTAPPTVSMQEIQTTRERFENEHQQNECASCHALIHGVGFTFEHYGALGEYRTTEVGKPIDASGGLPGTSIGDVANAIELSQRLAEEPAVSECLATHWLQFALAAQKDAFDVRGLPDVMTLLSEESLVMSDLVVEIAKSSAFRERLVSVPE